MSSSPSEECSIDRRAYLRTIAGSALLAPAAASSVATGSTTPSQDDTSADPAELADWSTTVSDVVVNRDARIDTAIPTCECGGDDPDEVLPNSEFDADDTGESVQLYASPTFDPRESDGDLEVPSSAYHEMLGEQLQIDPLRDNDDRRKHTLETPVKFVVKPATALYLVSATYLPFVGSGYWRYTFVVYGHAAAYVHFDWDQYDPWRIHNYSNTDPDDDMYARQYLNLTKGDQGPRQGFDSHGILLYQPSSRPDGELSLVTSQRDTAPYAVSNPVPDDVDGGRNDEGVEGFRIILDSVIKGVRDELLTRPLDTFKSGWAVTQFADLVQRTVDVSTPTEEVNVPDDWEEIFEPLFTDDYDVSIWDYDWRRNPVAHARMFSVDVPPIETQRPGSPSATPWSEFRVSDQYNSSAEGYVMTDSPMSVSNELSVRVPKLPRPEHAESLGYEIQEFCETEDGDCVYTAPEVEPMVTVAEPEVPWDLYYEW